MTTTRPVPSPDGALSRPAAKPEPIAKPGRRRHRPAAGWVPNQHGAWFMLATPLVVGILAATPRLVHLPLTLFWFAGYFAFFAASQWLKSRFKPRFRAATMTYAAVAATFGVLTLLLDLRLAHWIPWFLLPGGLGLLAAWRRRERSLWAGLVTVAAAMLMTPVAFEAGGGAVTWPQRWGTTGPEPAIWAATLVLTAYFAGTVLFVKSMIRERGNTSFRLLSVGYHAAATVLVGLVAWWLALPFVLLTARAAVMPRWRLSPRTVGLPEAVWSLVVTACAVVIISTST